ncbi:MAG: bifunctional diaminohydroxyphosphoribosylaminopyrimidine deaminase/5-amino-6-(5-phosphoribosylamino)uracil reductase RibD [Williamsia sp.]|nr:bifunctional diaminohydroxyphosphoribosylaminopyrimidine deaminase/5-amino-6-(5-phosphoribosylamino)uracil reductase RibD [Williamsia sp.]
MNLDEHYMHRCIELARLGAGSVAPNPMVGSVLVYENAVIGEGYHRRYGQPHAEVNCLQDAEDRHQKGMTKGAAYPFRQVLQKSTLYVSLEPCAHYGKTPPCADLIIRKEIPAVVVGCRDPFPQVDGKGIEKLVAAGVQVKTGILEQACKQLNKRFFTFHLLHRPFVVLKWAQTANRKIAATGDERTLISHELSNRLVHKWRSEEAAIMIGTNTALADNPSLTTRLWPGKNPVRLVLDKQLRLPGTRRLFTDGGKTIVFNYHKQGEEGAVSYHQIAPGDPVVKQILASAYHLGIQSILVEGGAALLQSCLDEQAWDEARIITNTKMQLAAGLDAPLLPVTEILDTEQLGDDRILTCRRMV